MDSVKKWTKSKGWTFWLVLVIIVILVLVTIFNINREKYEPNLDFLESNDQDYYDHYNKSTTPNKKWKREEMCRKVFESIYDVSFKSCRPNFLKNPETGRNLELDGYNDNLKIAFEHNGRHHYEYPNTFHKTKQEFLYQRAKDEYKRERCDKIGIYLISIPYHIKTSNIRSFIISKLPKDNLESLESICE